MWCSVNRIIVLTVDKICASMHEGVDDAACFRLVSELDVRVVMLVHQKSAPSRKSFGSMSVICHAFYTDLMAKLNIPPSACPSPWPAPAAKPVETKASSSKPMMKITASGKVDLPTLHQLGFHIGVLVVSAAQTHYVIKAMSEDWVELAPPGGVHERVHHAVLVDDYTLVPKEEHEQIILGKDHDAAASPDIVLEVAKSKLRIALAAAFRDHSSRVDVQRHPTKAVFADKRYAVGKLVLVPLSPSVVVHAISAKHPSAVECVVDEARFLIMPKTASEDCVVPFWHMRVIPDLAVGNMERHVVRMHVTVGKDTANAAIDIPVLRNTQILSKGDEVILYQQSTSSLPQKRQIPISAAAKRKAAKQAS
jgi:hypothetical protein